MITNFISIFLKIIVGQAFACPMCLSNDPNAKYMFYVLTTFVIFVTGVILFLLYTGMKYRNINNNQTKNDI